MDYLSNFMEETPQITAEKHLDPDLYGVQPASQGKVRFVYVLGRKCGYSQDDMKEFGHHHMTQYQIDKLIKDLKEESGEEDTWKPDPNYRKKQSTKQPTKQPTYYQKPLHEERPKIDYGEESVFF